MALRNQPYLPLYVQDFMTDEKLAECSAAANGVYIRLMCLMHKSEEYGKILLKQKDKQTDKQIKNFALKIAKFFPYDFDTVHAALDELLRENVLQMEGDYLIQKRMVHDADLSEKRSLSGKKGGEHTQSKNKKPLKKSTKNFAKAKHQANSENEIDIENENINDTKEKGGMGEKTLTNPFSEKFLHHWNLWKEFKKEQFKFQYKSVVSEQAAINELVNLSSGIEATAIAIINQSIAKTWKGFFELKTSNDGTKNKQSTTRLSSERLNEAFAAFHS